MKKKARIEKCPCGVCGMWELRKPSGFLRRRYKSHALAVAGMSKMWKELKELHMAGVHQARRKL